MTQRQIQRRNTYELIANDVLEMVRAQTMRPGDPISTERELMETYAVGRSSVREAIRVLESQGVIVPTSSGGFVVADFITPMNRSLATLISLQPTRLGDLYEVRRMIEVENAALAATRRTQQDITRIQRSIDSQQSATDTFAQVQAEPEAVITGVAADVEFHLAIATASRNALSLAIMESIRELIRRSQREIAAVDGVAQRSMQQHRDIFAAVQQGDADRARRAMLEHLTDVAQHAGDQLDRPVVPF